MKKPLFPKNVWLLGLLSLFNDTSSEIIFPLLPLFLSQVLGVNKAFIGLIEGVAESTASLLKLFSGWWSDKIQKRKSIIFMGYALSAFTKPLFAFSHSALQVLLLRATDRVGKGIRTAPRDALLAESTPFEDRGKAFGLHRAMDTFGAIIGPILAWILLSTLPGDFGHRLRLIFLVAFLPGFIGLWFIKKVKETPTNPDNPKPFKFSLKSFSPRFKFYLMIASLFALGNSSNVFLILKANAAGISDALIPMLWLVYNIVTASTSLPFGHLSDKIGRRKIIIIGMCFFAILYAAFGYYNSASIMWGLFALYGLYAGIDEGAQRAFAADLAPPDMRATAMGAYNFAIGIFTLPSSLIAGWLWDKFGSAYPFYFGALLAGLSAILLFLMKDETLK
jgi:MFS family permease